MKQSTFNRMSIIKSVLLLAMITIATSVMAHSGTRYVCTKTIYADGTVGKPAAWDKVIYLDFRSNERFVIHANWGDAVYGLRYNNNGKLIFEQMAQNNMVGPYVFCMPDPECQYVFSSDKKLLNIIHYKSNGDRSITHVYKQQSQAKIDKMYE